MGRLHFSGKDAKEFLSRVVTRNIADQKVGQSRYSLVCNEAGGVLDDVIVSRDMKNWLMVCNASNREKLVKHFTDIRRSSGLDFDMADQTESTAMVALQGPKVIERVARHSAGRYQGDEAISLRILLIHAREIHRLPQRLHRRRWRRSHPSREDGRRWR